MKNYFDKFPDSYVESSRRMIQTPSSFALKQAHSYLHGRHTRTGDDSVEPPVVFLLLFFLSFHVLLLHFPLCMSV